MSPAINPHSPFLDFLGIQIIEAKEGASLAHIQVLHGLMNPANTVHGGIVCSLADSAMGQALKSLYPPGTGISTVELKINYLRAVKTGVMECRARVVHQGRRFIMLEADITNEGRLIAKASSTFTLTSPSADAVATDP